MNEVSSLRIGIGMDSHRIASGGPMILGGLRLDVDMHFVGHSDADVLLHAVTDAILSAAGLPDIGQLYPNTSEENRGRDSADMLALGMAAVRDGGWSIINLDCIVQLEHPKLSPHKDLMKKRIAEILRIQSDQISVKGKTGEGVGEIGRGELCEATCVVLLLRAG